MAAKALQAEVGTFEPGFCQERFDDGGQESKDTVGQFTGFRVVGLRQDVALGTGEVNQRAAAFGKRFLRE